MIRQSVSGMIFIMEISKKCLHTRPCFKQPHRDNPSLILSRADLVPESAASEWKGVHVFRFAGPVGVGTRPDRLEFFSSEFLVREWQ